VGFSTGVFECEEGKGALDFFALMQNDAELMQNFFCIDANKGLFSHRYTSMQNKKNCCKT